MACVNLTDWSMFPCRNKIQGVERGSLGVHFSNKSVTMCPNSIDNRFFEFKVQYPPVKYVLDEISCTFQTLIPKNRK